MNLKSSMDRFIEDKYAGMSDVGLDLKSSMDRFIGFVPELI